jgi:uncharacterized Tic20 family protein
MEDNPFESPERFSAEPPLPGNSPILEKVKPPAIGLLVVGILNVLLSIFSLIMSVVGMMGMNQAMQQQQQQIENMKEQGMDPGVAQMFESIMSFQGPLSLVTNGIALVVGVFIIFGAMKMMKGQSYGMSLTAAIVAMIPCLSACCIVGLPIGIWATVVLSSADVKNAFRQS